MRERVTMAKAPTPIGAVAIVLWLMRCFRVYSYENLLISRYGMATRDPFAGWISTDWLSSRKVKTAFVALPFESGTFTR